MDEKQGLDELFEVEEAAETEAPAPAVIEEPAKPEPETTGVEVEPPSTNKAVVNVPLAALESERDKRQKLERELEDLRKQYAKPDATQKAPDFYQSPENYIEQRLLKQRLDASHEDAIEKYGAETVSAAVAWFDKNPDLSWKFADKPRPFLEAVKYYQKQAALEEIADPVTWKEQTTAQLREQIRQELLAEMKPERARIPGSLSAAPAAGKRPAPIRESSGDPLFD